MAKSKYSPALFEVMNQTRNAQSKTSASKWWPFGRSAAVANDASPDALPVQDAVGQDANIPTRPASLSPSTSSQLAVPQAVTATAVADRAKSSGGAVANLESCPTNIPTSEAAATTGIPSLFGGSSAMPGGESNDSPPVELANATAGAFFGKTPTPAVNESVCQIDGGRVRISLNTVQAAIASTVLVVALVLSFGVGRLSARPKMPVSDDAIAQTPADTTSNGAGNAAASMGTHAKKHSQVKPVSAVDAAKRK
ncbi:MAG: hypothetical protein FWC56_03690, partial [Phycisphaerae bacterium]|nr:hypothetical protein [Phycisphaerae bacterium]